MKISIREGWMMHDGLLRQHRHQGMVDDAWRPLPVHKKSCPAAKRGKLAKILVMSFPLKNLLFYLFLPEYEILIEKVREAVPPSKSDKSIYWSSASNF